MNAKKSSDYGRPIWVTFAIYDEINAIVEKNKEEGQKISVADVLSDLLQLRKIPRFIMRRLRSEDNVEIKKAYIEILTYITSSRKKKKKGNSNG